MVHRVSVCHVSCSCEREVSEREGTMLRALIFASLLPHVAAHGILTIPRGRPQGINPLGVKLVPFAAARENANIGCGGATAGLGSTTIPTTSFQAGQLVEIQWQLTIPHMAVDRTDTGVRIAIHYGATDSFECNILAGGLNGDPGFDPTLLGAENQVLSAGPVNAVNNSLVSTVVALPNKTCDYCVLQWTWAARVRIIHARRHPRASALTSFAAIRAHRKTMGTTSAAPTSLSPPTACCRCRPSTPTSQTRRVTSCPSTSPDRSPSA